jgi:DNA invertase Pin-like site-specific DNA recombinase
VIRSFHDLRPHGAAGLSIALDFYIKSPPTIVIYGYARVPTDGQGLDAQSEAASRGRGRKGIARNDQRRADRPHNRKGELIVTRLIHVARSTRDLLNTLAAIADKGAGFRSLGDTWADTTTAQGSLMLTVLGGLGELERELSRTRASEGRARGRPLKLTTYQRKEAIERRDKGEETLVEIGRSYNVNASTISRLMP